MEVLNNFSSIYCFIAFILGAMFMFTTLCVAAMCKTQEPKYRPFKTKEECWNEMMKHQPFGWVKEIYSEMLYLINGISDMSIVIMENIDSFKEAMNIYEFKDGTPFGIKEE